MKKKPIFCEKPGPEFNEEKMKEIAEKIIKDIKDTGVSHKLSTFLKRVDFSFFPYILSTIFYSLFLSIPLNPPFLRGNIVPKGQGMLIPHY